MFSLRSYNDLDATGGTVKLVDCSSTRPHLRDLLTAIATCQLKSKGNSDIVLVPQPADDPNDPLKWSVRKKGVAAVSVMFFAGMGGWIIGGIGSGIPLLIDEFGKDLNETVDGAINWSVLALGAGNFVWLPAALYFGTRPIFLLSTLMQFATLIWCAVAHSWASLVASRVLSAFASSCGEAVTAMVVKDLFFLHERGWWMGLYMFFFQSLGALGVIISGFVITGAGWRWHFWLTAICGGVNFIVIALFFPETQFCRESAVGVPQVSGNTEPNSKLSAEKDSGSHMVEALVAMPPKKTFLQELNPWSGINPGIEKDTNFFYLLIRPWAMVLYPAVIFSFFVFSFNLGCLLGVLNTAASVFQSSPYNMSPGVQSLIFLPEFFGVAIGSYCGGGLTDRLIQWQTRRNNGVFESEQRLVALVLPLFLVPTGVLMYGIGVAHLSSAAVPFIGNGLIGFGMGALPSITMSYVVDSYYLIAPDLMLLVVALKNIFGFGFSYAVIPWINATGYINTFVAMAFILFALVLFGAPLYYWGKQIRIATAKWRIILW